MPHTCISSRYPMPTQEVSTTHIRVTMILEHILDCSTCHHRANVLCLLGFQESSGDIESGGCALV